MEFLAWHYSEGLSFYANRYLYSLRSIVHYFSLPVLLTSLFSPWKRLVVTKKRAGFDLATYFSDLSFNLVSRFVGAAVRIILFISGVAAYLLFAIFGAIGFLLWLVIPVFSIGVYQKYRNNPQVIARRLWEEMKKGDPIEVLAKSAPGVFLIEHLGINKERLVEEAHLPKKKLSTRATQTIGLSNLQESGFINELETPNSFEEIIALLLKNQIWAGAFLREENTSEDDFITAAKWWDNKKSEESISEIPAFTSPGIGRNLLFGYTPLLSKVSTDMGAETDFSHHLIGRHEVVARMQRVLSSGKSIILTGEPGVGKKTVVYEFARRAMRGEFGANLSYRRVMELDYNFVFAESTDKNRKKQQIADIFAESSAAGNIILVLRDLHRLTANEAEGMDLTDILETYLEKGRLKIIVISTREDYEKYVSRNAKLRKFFETVEVTEPSPEEAREILLEAAGTWERKKKITITVGALNKILSGSEQYITDTPFPEKALELLDAVIFREEQKDGDGKISLEDVNEALSEKTGISFANINSNQAARLANLEEIIHERLVNQSAAIELIAKVLRSKSLGVVETKRPIGSFLFLGPTGVGKTETAKVLAKVYFGGTDKIIRFDMAEYVGREGLERLIGSVEKNMPGALTTAIKNSPAALLLLDEIEKAPPDVYNLFLAMLDEGSVTDAFGKKISCSNLFVIATTNAGAEYIRQLVSDNSENLQERVVEHILKNNIFSPEFINRFDGVVVYEPLSPVHLIKVSQILLNELSANLNKKNINVTFSDKAVEKVAQDGYEPAFGARPMRRIIELSIGDLLGRAMLSGEIKPGDTVIVNPGEEKGQFTWVKKA